MHLNTTLYIAGITVIGALIFLIHSTAISITHDQKLPSFYKGPVTAGAVTTGGPAASAASALFLHPCTIPVTPTQMASKAFVTSVTTDEELKMALLYAISLRLHGLKNEMADIVFMVTRPSLLDAAWPLISSGQVNARVALVSPPLKETGYPGGGSSTFLRLWQLPYQQVVYDSPGVIYHPTPSFLHMAEGNKGRIPVGSIYAMGLFGEGPGNVTADPNTLYPAADPANVTPSQKVFEELVENFKAKGDPGADFSGLSFLERAMISYWDDHGYPSSGARTLFKPSSLLWLSSDVASKRRVRSFNMQLCAGTPSGELKRAVCTHFKNWSSTAMRILMQAPEYMAYHTKKLASKPWTLVPQANKC
jgi:hypothetical protein